MKNLLYLLFVLPLLFSCGDASEGKKENKKDMSKVSLKGGDDKDYELDVLIQGAVKDIMTYVLIQKVAESANSYAKYGVKNRRTYKPNTDEELFFSGDDNDNDTLCVSFKIIAANSYGVEGDLSCLFYFDKNGNEIKDESFVREF